MIRAAASFLASSLLYAALGFAFEGGALRDRIQWKMHPQSEDAAIKSAVDLYNEIFTDLYTSDGMVGRLNDFPASKQQSHELYRNLGFLRQRGLVLVYDMASRVFIEIKRTSPAVAEALVFEEWNYLYQKADTRLPAENIKGMGQGFRYILNRWPDKWAVIDYFPEDVEVVKRDEFLF